MQAGVCKSLFDPEIIRSGDDFLSWIGLIGDIMSLGAKREKLRLFVHSGPPFKLIYQRKKLSINNVGGIFSLKMLTYELQYSFGPNDKAILNAEVL